MAEKRNDKMKFGEDVLKRLFEPSLFPTRETLKELFDRRITELNISPTNVLDILKIQSRTLHGILDGTQKTVDYTNLKKVAGFLQLPKEEVIRLYIESLEKNFPDEGTISPEKIEFIQKNFDLSVLQKIGFIDSVTDFRDIEKKIVSFFGLKDILDYERPQGEVAFSAGITKPKNELTRGWWINTANNAFEGIENPYDYDREALIKYFPKIRWHSTSVELGLKSVIRDLFKLGITVCYVPPMPSVHLRGATFSVNNKPCIVLTDYMGFYPTLWFALVHELFHVLFDWEEISTHSYHVSDADNEQLSVREKEAEADNFAREYFFSNEKMAKIRPYLNDADYVKEYAFDNHVHPSFIYVFHAKDVGDSDRMAWTRARKHNPEEMENLLRAFDNPWNNPKPISDFIKVIRFSFYK